MPAIPLSSLSKSGRRGTSNHLVEFDKDLTTRNICIIGPGSSWILSLSCVPLAYESWKRWSSSTSGEHPVYLDVQPSLWVDAAQHLIHLIVTLLIQSLGLIHTTTLRWALQREERITFNANLRLLSSSWLSKPNKWYANVVVLFGMVLSYSSPAAIFLYDNRKLNLTLNPIALTALSVVIAIQAAVVTWSLLSSNVPTWSSSPFDAVKACQRLGMLHHSENRCMLGVSDMSRRSAPVTPKAQHVPPFSAHSEVKWVLVVIWSLAPLALIWAAAIYSMILGEISVFGTPGTNWSPVPQTIFSTAGSSFLSQTGVLSDRGTYYKRYWAFFSPGLNIVWGRGKTGKFLAAFYQLLIICALQAILTLALHCAELLINLSRDEAAWRAAASKSGAPTKRNAIAAAFTSWETVSFFLYKAVIHWFFSVSVTLEGAYGYPKDDMVVSLCFRPIQIFYMGLSFVLLAVTVTFIGMRKQQGPQPVTYGHLRSLADLIDEWPPRVMYWGHKGEKGGICHSGTGARPLGPIQMGRLYA